MRVLRQVQVARRPWIFNSEVGEDQIGGFVKEFTNLAFLTVKVRGSNGMSLLQGGEVALAETELRSMGGVLYQPLCC